MTGSNRTRAVALSAALSLAACAGGTASSNPVSRSKPLALTKNAYIARADGICQAAETTINNLDPPVTDDDLDDYANEIMSISNDAIADLRALQPPPGDAAILDAMIDSLAMSVRLIPDYVRAREDQDSKRARDIEARLGEIQDETKEVAREYGFERCGEDEGSPTS